MLDGRGLTFSVLFCAALTGYITASFCEVFRSEKLLQAGVNTAVSFSNVNFVNSVSPVRMLIITLFIFALLTGAALLMSKAIGSDKELAGLEGTEKKRLTVLPVHISLLLSSLAFAYLLAVSASTQMYKSTFSEFGTHPHADVVFIAGIALVMIIIVKYLSDGDKLMLGELSSARVFSSWKAAYVAVALCSVVFSAVFTVFTYYRYLSFSSSAFDFGIFAQMFEKMATTGLPLTTVERVGEVSHFTVHFSPSWYLLLPGYMLFRSPFCLYLMNAVLTALGAFPVFRIAKKTGASPLTAAAFSLVYLFFPSMGAGLFFDIHENSLLPVLLLYTAWFFIDGKTVPMLIFTFLTLGVKEDSAVLVASFALYAIFAAKRRRTGLMLLLISCAYFFFASGMITFLGGKVMSLRLEAYYPDGVEKTGFLTPLKTIVYDVGFFIKKVFDTDAAVPETARSQAQAVGDGKLAFIIWMLLPTLFAPFLSKKNGLLFLLIPLVAENLMLSWPYQYDVYYQYTYGPAAFIILASVLSIVSMPKDKRKTFLLCSVVLCIIMSGALFWPKADKYRENYLNGKAAYDAKQATIELFLDSYYKNGESVSTTDKEMPHLAAVTDIHLMDSPYKTDSSTDWIVISKDSSEGEYSSVIAGYECVNPEDKSSLRIFRKPAD